MIKKEILEKEYITNEKPMWQIAKEYNIAVGTVFNYLKKYRYNNKNKNDKNNKRKDK